MILWLKGTLDKKNENKKPSYQSSPVKSVKVKDREFNCMECYFQGTGRAELNKHISLKHRKDEKCQGAIICRICGESFSAKWNLMNHRKYLEMIAFCRNNIDGKCTYADNMCWWNHNEQQNESIKCFISSDIFESSVQMMRHRKRNHVQIVKMCSVSTEQLQIQG